MSKKKLTMVVPAYNEEEALPIFYEEAHRVEEEISGVEIEYLFIDDGSSDKTLEVLRSLHKKDARVRYVSFSRNLVRRRLFMRACRMQQEIMWQF